MTRYDHQRRRLEPLPTITRDDKLRALALPLDTAKAERRRRLWRSTYAVRTMAIVSVVAAIFIACGHAVIAACGLIAGGFWIVTDQARRAARLDGSIPGWWIEEAITTDLSDKGRAELTAMLLRPSITAEDALAWARAELRRARPVHAPRHTIAEQVRF